MAVAKSGAVTPFEKYFATHFQTSLNSVGTEKVFADGGSIKDASWDRKAAYLLWVELGRPGDHPENFPEVKVFGVKPVDTDEWDIL